MNSIKPAPNQISELSDSSNRIINQEDLYQFWSTIPCCKKIYVPNSSIIGQEVRSSILKMLREGINDQITTDEAPKKRYALNVADLLKYVNESVTAPPDKDSFSKQNIYFHIKALKDAKLVREIGQIRKGRHSVTYYGRTARMFLITDTDPQEETPLKGECCAKDKPIVDLVKELNPERNIKEIEDIFTKYRNEHNQKSDMIVAWIEKHEKLLTTMNADIIKIYTFLVKLCTNEIPAAKEITTLFKIHP